MLADMDLRALAATATAYVVLHHLGLLPDGLGEAPRGTRWADWLDLAVPWLVIGTAAWALWSATPSRRVVGLFLAGAIAYTSGHGIHLAANSVGNAEPSATAHLWDEPVGHNLWFLGVALVTAALAACMSTPPRGGVGAHLLAAAVGATWASNAIGGEAVALGVAGAAGATYAGWRHRGDLAGVLATAGAVALLWLGVATASW